MNKQRYWQVCDKGVCLYREDARTCRCIKHGAILTFRPWLTGLSRKEAKKRVQEDRHAG